MKCKWCGARITAERRTVYCSNKCYQESRREEHKKTKEEIKSGAVLKSVEVCKGCKYLLKGQTELKNTCNYLEITGHSRVLVEMEHGGVKADSCCCYEKK